jgi:two-component system CheB/CheR fusion protein
MNLDIGLPLDRVMPLLRGVMSEASDDGEVTLDAVNRRGKPVVVRVRVSPMIGPERDVRGAIVVMEEVEPETAL